MKPEPLHPAPPEPPPPPQHHLGFELPRPRHLSRRRLAALTVVVLALATVAFAVGWVPHAERRAAVEQSARAATTSVRRVEVVAPAVVSSARELLLPGSVQPLEETVVYARVNGYVRRWLVDIGDRVRGGQMLAEIDTPELDQELAAARAQQAQAQAALLQARANRDLSRTELGRYERLAPAGIATAQELEQRRARALVDEAGVRVAEANVAAQEANLARLAKLEAFARVAAPFDGVVTQRSIDRGALVAAGTSTPLFRVVAMDPVRVFVQVPQDVAPSVRAGAAAKVFVREYPGVAFEGQVSRAAGALDAASRTMNTEVRVPNRAGKLLPGMYAQASLNLTVPHRVLTVPATALITDAKGSRVAVVGDDGRLRLVEVSVERDTGSAVELASGLSGAERVVRIGNPSLADGMRVEVASEVAQRPGAATGG